MFLTYLLVTTLLVQQPLNITEVTKLRKMMDQDVDTIRNLVGLDKIQSPPVPSKELILYRAKWRDANPDITPYLGLWTNEWEMFPPFFSLSIFPSTIKNKLCIIEYQDNQYQSYGPFPGETIPPNPPPIFSTVTMVNGEFVGDRLHLHPDLLIKTQFEGMDQSIEFLDPIITGNSLRLYAAKTVPSLAKNIPTEIMQKFTDHQCRISGSNS